MGPMVFFKGKKRGTVEKKNFYERSWTNTSAQRKGCKNSGRNQGKVDGGFAGKNAGGVKCSSDRAKPVGPRGGG